MGLATEEEKPHKHACEERKKPFWGRGSILIYHRVLNTGHTCILFSKWKHLWAGAINSVADTCLPSTCKALGLKGGKKREKMRKEDREMKGGKKEGEEGKRKNTKTLHKIFLISSNPHRFTLWSWLTFNSSLQTKHR